ncbi:MAG TPA: ester cyclase [Solirubrobacteraceae bacterium]|jgi:steroid delta-isomerase-like uncharacterized protein|nr:ester cyclase [Solirubrobacteraceae bacterium]
MSTSEAGTVDGLMDRWEGAWSERDPTLFEQVCAADVHYEDPLTPEPLHGPAQLAQHAARLWRGLPDVRLERTGQRLTDGRFVVAPCKLLGTHRQELEGLPASGSFVVVHTVFYCELDASRRTLWRVRAFFDAYDAAVQIGVLPTRGSMGERALMVMRGFGVPRPRRR